MRHRIVKIIFLGLAFLFTVMGAVGVILPVLPTTPFLLLATFFFAKSSEKFHKWFIATKLYQRHLDSFVKTRAMTLKTKLGILLPASCMLIIAFVFVPIWHARILIIAVFLFKYYYFFFHIRTIKKQSSDLKESDRAIY